MAAEAAIGGALSLIPYVEQKAVALKSLVSDKYKAKRRAREYNQLRHWIRSSLKVSTALDWGHTCELADSIQNAGNSVLGSRDKRSCWIFTSRALVGKAIGLDIDADIWLRIVECFIVSDLHEVNFPAMRNRDGGSLLVDVVKGRLEGSGYAPMFEHEEKLLAHWIFHWSDKARSTLRGMEQEIERESHERGSFFERSDHAEVISRCENELKEYLDTDLEYAFHALRVLKGILDVFHSSNALHRCNNSHGKRALQVRTCDGPTVDIDFSEAGPKSTLIQEQDLLELKNQWLCFISSWDTIIEKASEQFDFPVRHNVADLIFHDMATGYAASTAMLRRGAKCTDDDGTTIVHPGERAAAVSSRCALVTIDGSALEKNGVKRKWKDAAVEFARYALLRCDLVKRSRMTLTEAIKDWTSQYTSWDRVPDGGKLSLWNNCFSSGTTGDDYRLVLIRQALGEQHSIDMVAGIKKQCSLFGGFLPTEEEFDFSRHRENVLLVDRPLKLHVGIITYPIDGTDCILDTWGAKDCTKTGRASNEDPLDVVSKRRNEEAYLNGNSESRQYFYCKSLEPTGRPRIFRLNCQELTWTFWKRESTTSCFSFD